MRNVVEISAFDGFEIGKDKILVSHLQFADDTMLLGKVSVKKTKIMKIKIFEIALGLKVNFHKSSIHGINLPRQHLEVVANLIKCNIRKIPFSYLGLPIGASFWQKLSI